MTVHFIRVWPLLLLYFYACGPLVERAELLRTEISGGFFLAFFSRWSKLKHWYLFSVLIIFGSMGFLLIGLFVVLIFEVLIFVVLIFEVLIFVVLIFEVLILWCLFLRCLSLWCLFLRFLFLRCLFLRCLFMRCLFWGCLFL